MERIKQALDLVSDNKTVESGIAAKSPRRRTATEAIVYTQTRRLALDPAHLERKRIYTRPDSKGAEAYNLLRTQVLQRMRVNQWQTLAITSPNDGAGKTLTAINLAISLAREVNQTVLLVDLDLRRPSVGGCITAENLPGIGDYLMDDTPLSQLMFNPDGIDRLVVLPGSRAFVSSSEMLSSPKMVALAEELKNRYPSRLVLFDMPPVLSCDDVLAFSPHFDAALLVVEENVTGREDIRRAVALLEQTSLVGALLNKSSGTQLTYA